MKLSIELPDEWGKVLRQAALDTDCRSVSEFVRRLIEQSPDIAQAQAKTGVRLPDISRSWGGAREQDAHLAQDAQTSKSASPQDEHLPQDAPRTTIKPDKPIHNSLVMPSPADVIAERKRLAAARHPGIPPRKGE